MSLKYVTVTGSSKLFEIAYYYISNNYIYQMHAYFSKTLFL